MTIRKLLLFLLSTTMMTGAFPAEDVWQHIEGLPCEEAYDVTQDGLGYIWIGTRLGLIRYDGYNMDCYRNDMAHPYAFSSCNIKCLASDGCYCLYAGSFFGLNSMDLRTHRMGFHHFEGNDYVSAVLCDRSGRVWIGTDNGLYLKQSDGIPTYYTYENSNFKVTVGDFRNKSEAAALLQKIKRDFPDAFVVRESFRFPSLENQTMFRIDTVKVLRPID